MTPTASAKKFDMPPYVVMLVFMLPLAAGTAWMLLQWDMSPSAALFGGGLLATIALGAAFLLLAPVLVFHVIPVLTVVAIVVQALLVVAAALLRAVALGFMSRLRSAAARRPADPFHQ